VHGPSELVFLSVFSKVVISSVAALALVFIVNAQLLPASSCEERLFVMLDMVFAACVAQSVFVVLTFLIPEFRDFLSSTLVNRGNIDANHLFRFRGLHDSGGANLSLALALGGVYGFYSSLVLNRGRFSLRLVSSCLVLFAVMLVGRTGLVVLILGVGAIFAFFPLRIFSLRFLLVMLVILVLYILAIWLYPEKKLFFVDHVFSYAFEAFLNLVQSGRFSSSSTDDLFSMIFLPDMLTLMVGNGSFDSANAGVDRSDSGYMKILLSSGIFGFIAFYSMFFYISFRLLKSLKRFQANGFFLAFFIFVIILAEVKEPILIQNDVARIFYLIGLMVFSFSMSNRNRI
jgi:hypothetical protein